MLEYSTCRDTLSDTSITNSLYVIISIWNIGNVGILFLKPPSHELKTRTSTQAIKPTHIQELSKK